MERYKDFVAEIKEKQETFEEGDWKGADEEYAKFSEEWYRKFEDEFTFKEKLILSKYEIQYNYIKAKKEAIDIFDVFVREDYEELREQVKYYADNDMEEDLKTLVKEAKEVGDSAVKMLEEIITELEIEANRKN
ncbi:MAG: hypothetical protein JKX84_04765 [Flavobacteriales bacterium]|nr:hypothetical protein [Flavobacteriales bacterium]